MSIRRAYLGAALDAVAAGGGCPEPDPSDAWQLAVASFIAGERLDFARGRELADAALRALAPDADAVARVTAAGASGMAAAADLTAGEWTDAAPGLTPSGDPLVDALPHLDALEAGDEAEFARYLLAEAALSCGRLELAAALPLPDPARFLPRDGAPHPFATVFTVLAARVAAFHGRIPDAHAVLDGAASALPLYALLLDATRALVAGNASELAATRELADRVVQTRPEPRDRISAGCYLLASYGLLGFYDIPSAAALLLAAGGDADLEHLLVTDRAIGFELLAHAALVDGDLGAAEAWGARAEPLAGSPIANATVLRTRSRILFGRGEFAAARDAAVRASELGRAEGRMIEAIEADMLASRAELAAGQSGAASRRLQALAQDAARTGFEAGVRNAAVQLRLAGRRLRPFAGTGWTGLSEREREVAELMLEGLTNGEIAGRLYLSAHTVRAHVSRVLAAFGVASRVAFAARLTVDARQPDDADAALDGLTERQRAVVAVLATGASNTQIAEQLGISVKTVEKHLHEIMRRLGVTTRVGVLRLLAPVRDETAPPLPR
ncbi:MAG: helix-turn-helix transcriptional regulator [Protaetiibacter sp.]